MFLWFMIEETEHFELDLIFAGFDSLMLMLQTGVAFTFLARLGRDSLRTCFVGRYNCFLGASSHQACPDASWYPARIPHPALRQRFQLRMQNPCARDERMLHIEKTPSPAPGLASSAELACFGAVRNYITPSSQHSATS
jgi:hypothetical protein